MIDLARFHEDGFVVTEPVLQPDEIAPILKALEEHTRDVPSVRRGGLRDVLDMVPALAQLKNHPAIREIADEVLGGGSFVVRSTLFDKTPESNWKVPWHQDVTIAVEQRIEADGFGPWSVKAGVQHVQPPSAVLERMVTIRVHLDDCPAGNGPLRVMPRTHRLGKLNQNHVEAYVDESRAVCCEASAGCALVMRPLLLHTSSAATDVGHRRVIHFDFAGESLGSGLKWRMV